MKISPFSTNGDSEPGKRSPFIIKTGSDNPLIDYHLKSTRFGKTCQQEGSAAQVVCKIWQASLMSETHLER